MSYAGLKRFLPEKAFGMAHVNERSIKGKYF
jgi:hypothetical protein